jgi:MFS family permease
MLNRQGLSLILLLYIRRSTMMLKIIIPKDFKAFKNIFTSLHSRNYRLYFTGQGISLVGTWMQNIALSWLVYRLTGSVFLLGLIGFTSQIPTFILAPFSGVLTDRYSRLKIMTLTQVFFMLHALTMALLVLFNLIEVWQIIALSIVFGIISAFDAPARQSLVIELIDNPNDLGNAIALNSAIFNGARLVGPAVAGIAIAAVGEGICFLLNTISFVAVIIALLQIKIPVKQVDIHPSNFKKSFIEGLHYTFQSMPIRTLIIILAMLSLFGMPFIVLLPAYAKEILQGSSDTLGYLMSALGAGALIAAMYMAARKTVLGLGRIIAASIVIMGLSIVLASFSGKMYFSLIVFFFGGLSMILSLSSINTMLQTIADEDKRGRVMSFYAMALMGTAPIGNLLAGTIASGIGISFTILICGIITALSGIWFELNRKSLRKYVRPIYINKGILPGLPNDIT